MPQGGLLIDFVMYTFTNTYRQCTFAELFGKVGVKLEGKELRQPRDRKKFRKEIARYSFKVENGSSACTYAEISSLTLKEGKSIY